MAKELQQLEEVDPERQRAQVGHVNMMSKAGKITEFNGEFSWPILF